MIASEQDEELKKAYTEMLEGCLRHPDQWDWYAIWMIEKTDGTHIGDLCFKGLRENGIAEIGYGTCGSKSAGGGNGGRKRSVTESPRKMRLSPQRDHGRGRAAVYLA